MKVYNLEGKLITTYPENKKPLAKYDLIYKKSGRWIYEIGCDKLSTLVRRYKPYKVWRIVEPETGITVKQNKKQKPLAVGDTVEIKESSNYSFSGSLATVSKIKSDGYIVVKIKELRFLDPDLKNKVDLSLYWTLLKGEYGRVDLNV
jgi:hypothetical protein